MDLLDDLTFEKSQKLTRDEADILKTYFNFKGTSKASQTGSNNVWTIVYLTILFAILNAPQLQFIYDKVSFNRNVHLAIKALIFFAFAYLIILKLD